jgi:hypothetical protein
MSRAPRHLSAARKHRHRILTTIDVYNRVPIFRCCDTTTLLQHFFCLNSRFIQCAAVTCRSRQQHTEPVPWRFDNTVAELRNNSAQAPSPTNTQVAVFTNGQSAITWISHSGHR